MFLTKLYGKGGDWISEDLSHDWTGNILKYMTVSNLSLNGQSDVPCYCFVRENKDKRQSL